MKTSWGNFEVRTTTGRRPISVNLGVLGPVEVGGLSSLLAVNIEAHLSNAPLIRGEASCMAFCLDHGLTRCCDLDMDLSECVFVYLSFQILFTSWDTFRFAFIARP